MIPLLVLLLVLVAVWSIARITALGAQHNAIAAKLAELELQLRDLREKLRTLQPATLPAAIERPTTLTVPAPIAAPSAAPVQMPMATADTAVAAVNPAAPLEPAPVPPRLEVPPLIATAPPPLAAAGSAGVHEAPAEPRGTAIDWEQFMGAKLFAWLGGLAAFLGAAFFVKYSFEHDLIPPSVRVALGFLFGLGLVAGGLLINRRRYAPTAQTLCATGVVVLYAVTFACNAFYRFPFFGPVVTFALMSLITVAAFALAVRLDAKVVAVLGLLGGFLTPVLISTGRDNPVGLFSYVALLDAGLIALALHRRWFFVVTLGCVATILMQIAWAVRFLTATKASTAMVICLAFSALFFAAYLAARRVLLASPDPESAEDRGDSEVATVDRVPRPILGAAIAAPFVGLAFAAAFLGYPGIAGRPGLLFAYVLAADALLLALAWLDEHAPRLHLAAGVAVFALLAAWTADHLRPPLLGWALAIYLLYALLHSAYPLLLERHRPAAAPTWWSQLFPPLALLLMLGPLLKLDPVPIGLWPAILLVDLLAIGLALATGSLAALAVVLLLTLGVTALWILGGSPADSAGEFVLVIGGFAVLFFAAGLFLARRLGSRISDTDGFLGGPRGQLPAFSALLPFLLLIMVTQRLALANPSPVFGLGLLLVAMTFGLTRLLTGGEPAAARDEGAAAPAADSRARAGIGWLPALALAGATALEFAWRARQGRLPNPALALAWFALFPLVFAVFPFLFQRAFASLTGPWAVAALAPVAHFPLVYPLVRQAWPNDYPGLLPAVFAVPPLVGLIARLRTSTADSRARLNQLAWFGGVALLFITLIIPMQFRRQWITIGWAVEGVALLWLFQRVPHAGLRATGFVLLVIAFARLALNPAVLQYHARTGAPLFNWYLYAYGVVTACLFVGARLLAQGSPADPPGSSGRTLGVNGVAVLATLGVILAFLLLNIQIADYFSVPGSRVLTFEFSGNFARDMSYTIGWALFALALLLAGIWRRNRPGRIAALVLLGVALLKLFLHDLAQLEALYRIGALFAVAVIAIVASVVYQRFLPAAREAPRK